MKPESSQIVAACKDVAWEYAAMLAAAVEMAKDQVEPVNHFVQEAFLVHVRNLAEFFRLGVAEFRLNPATLLSRGSDNIYAVDFCHSVLWDERPFGKKTKLIKAINKTLSHLTYSRNLTMGLSEIDLPFDGHLHVHGAVALMRRTWQPFMMAVRPEYQRPQLPNDIQYWLAEHTKGWVVKFGDLESEFETRAKRWAHWRFNETPDGPV